MKNQRPSLREYRGARLVEKRLAAGLTREQLAAKARVSTLTLKNWERGRTKPQPDKVRAVREVLADAVPTPDIDRHALRADVENLLGVTQNLLMAVAHVEKHLDPEVRDMLTKLEVSRNGSK